MPEIKLYTVTVGKTVEQYEYYGHAFNLFLQAKAQNLPVTLTDASGKIVRQWPEPEPKGVTK